MKIDWIRKLSSRKFWMAVAGFVSGIIIYCGGTPERATATEGLIMSMAAIIVYIFAEAATDAYHGEHEADNNDESD